ncbi:MAG TPA: PBP1A family penicillin-binding protein [Oligoflexia bacterium]|nr:PBP1A family penicillin-binding protein [Oligoflexia bacterium]HMR24357.1 PBP1A family penicillin-binding protein [Oligoflexia bacterium]
MYNSDINAHVISEYYKQLSLKIKIPLFIIAISFSISLLFLSYISWNLPSVKSLKNYQPFVGSEVFTRDNVKIGEFYSQRRVFLPLENINKNVIDAFLAGEDANFYSHSGISFMGIMRAAIKNFVAGSYKQGGSTITQQVAKILLLSSEKKLIRKLREVLLAFKIERSLEKDEILEIYLNEIYLGDSAYGIEAAAQTYFGKNSSELSLGQIAMIAGLTRAPSRDNPRKSLENAQNKKNYILARMHDEGYIDKNTLQLALNEPLQLESALDLNLRYAPYFVEHVRREVMAKYGADEVLKKGLKIYTTIHSKAAIAAHEAIKKSVIQIDKHQGYRGPIANIPEQALEDTLKKIEEDNPSQLSNEHVYQAIVTDVDDKKKLVTIDLAFTQGTIALENMSWARKPNENVYWAYQKINTPSRALKKNDHIYVQWLNEQNFALYQKPEVQAALIAVNPFNGMIEAMVGGNDFERSEFNRAIQAKRQPGSAFKPIVFSAALEKGYTPGSIIVDSPIVYDDPALMTIWKPKNYAGEFHGNTIFRDCLIQSRNIPSIKILQDVGVPYLSNFAKRMGINTPLESNLSLALGASAISPLELVTAYSVFASGGQKLKPTQSIIKVINAQGDVLEQNFPDEILTQEIPYPDPYLNNPIDPEPYQQAFNSILEEDTELPESYALAPQHAYIMTHLLKEVISVGTGARARDINRPAAGKTGTTNDNHDAWFVGFTPQMVSAVWFGYDDSSLSLGVLEDGGRIASPVWLDFMKNALDGSPSIEFRKPEGLVYVEIDSKTGLLASQDSKKTVREYFVEGTQPQNSIQEDQQQSTSSQDFFMDE